MPRQPGSTPENIVHMRHNLLDWYHRNKRDLPWRQTNDPYAIWVSEIMLQQTRVAAVIERYTVFLQHFPTVQALAAAEEQDVLALWSGLGYYRRARMLQKAAREVVIHHGGILPVTAAELHNLPGIGSYTSAAIASIAHNEPIAVVDGNVERVLSRIRAWHSDDTASEAAVRRKVQAFAQTLIDPRHPADYNQAIMELGATLCTPRNPQCLVCPCATACRTLGEHRTPKRAPMTACEIACALVTRKIKNQIEILLHQRPATASVMPGLWELPALDAGRTPGTPPLLTVRHAIMQVNYTVQVHAFTKQFPGCASEAHRRWVPAKTASTMALTGLTRKVLAKARLLPTSIGQPAFAGSSTLEVV